jgi:hypothetical protein
MNVLHIPLSNQWSIINENIVNIHLIVDRCVLDATSCLGANCTSTVKQVARLLVMNSTVVHEICGAKISPK